MVDSISMSIIIPVLNNWNFTKSLLRDLYYLSDKNEVIIFDNGSDDETIWLQDIEKAKEKGLFLPKKLLYIRSEKNLGFGAACNRAYEKSQGEKILFLNNDVRISHKAEWTFYLELEYKSKSKNKNNKNIIMSPSLGLLDSNLNFVSETNSRSSRVSKLINDDYSYLSGWFLYGSKETFNKLILPNHVGPFDEDYFVYHEDTDLSFRAKELGISLELITSISDYFFHFGRMTSKKVGVSKLFLESKKVFISKWKDKFSLKEVLK